MHVRQHLNIPNKNAVLRSERGQIAIFIALIFQVLFVFFAMIVNVGLIVHDKINLQNSVDLAAFYGAQRQAELLNAIAQENYKIRQAWKLLSWRIRVLGAMGYKWHPMQESSTKNTEVDMSAYGSPSICVNTDYWGVRQNLCHDESVRIEDIPAYTIINIFSPENFIYKEHVDQMREAQRTDQQGTGPMNFSIAMRWIAAYRMQIARSKETIRLYANLLSSSTSEFKDVRGQTVKGGALQTMVNNLTRANLASLKADENSFHFYNSLGIGREQWLNEVPITPYVYYTDMVHTSGAWVAVAKPIFGTGSTNRPSSDQKQNSSDDFFRNEPSDTTSLYHSIYGVEKNPWQMAYVGVYAETQPRKPYLPFGSAITLKAKAFAKPFGGRIGPWYYNQWPQGSLKSSASSDQRADQLMPIPVDESGASAATKAERSLFIPNYSRFPGDGLGLNSAAALALFKAKMGVPSGRRVLRGYYSDTPDGNDGLAMADSTDKEFASYNKLIASLGYAAPWIREFEMAAIAPDLFDITYYSVDQNGYYNYIAPSVKSKLLTLDKASYDLGSWSGTVKTVGDQVNIAVTLADQIGFWVVRNVNHLLTGWAPSGAFQYDFPSSFGECYNASSDAAPVPGKCAIGGRVGYSVKIVAEDYLNSSDLSLGNGSTGKISNPPPSSF